MVLNYVFDKSIFAAEIQVKDHMDVPRSSSRYRTLCQIWTPEEANDCHSFPRPFRVDSMKSCNIHVNSYLSFWRRTRLVPGRVNHRWMVAPFVSDYHTYTQSKRTNEHGPGQFPLITQIKHSFHFTRTPLILEVCVFGIERKDPGEQIVACCSCMFRVQLLIYTFRKPLWPNMSKFWKLLAFALIQLATTIWVFFFGGFTLLERKYLPF